MESNSESRLFVEITAHSLQLAVVAGRKLLALDEFALAQSDEIKGFLEQNKVNTVETVLISPSSLGSRLGRGDELKTVRTAEALIKHAETTLAGVSGPQAVVAFDAASGQRVESPGNTPWVIAAASKEQVEEILEKVAAFGLDNRRSSLALPARLGAITAALQETPETTIALVDLGEEQSCFALVSAAGVELLASVEIGFANIFGAVQSELGLKFRAAASKLFFNPNYDFGDSSQNIAAAVSGPLKAKLDALNAKPTGLFVTGLPAAQGWLGQGMAASVGLTSWTLDPHLVAGRLGLEVEGNVTPPPTSASLLMAAAAGLWQTDAWVPYWLDEARPAQAAAPAPTPAVLAEPAPAPPAPAPPAPPPAPPVPAPNPVPPLPRAAAPAPRRPVPPPSKTPAARPVAPAPVAPVAPPAPSPMQAAALVASVSNPDPAPVTQPPLAAAPMASPVKTGSKLPLIIGVVVAVLVLAVVLFAVTGGGSAKKAEAEAARLEAEALAVETAAAEAARLERLAILRTEVTRDSRSFRSDHYAFEVTDKGFIRQVRDSGEQVLLDSVGAVNLQGSYLTPEGRRVWFYAGGIGNSTYTAVTEKTIVGENIVFNVKVSHPRFELTQVFTCLADRINVTVDFTPIRLQDDRGGISAIYAVQLWPAGLNASQRLSIEGSDLIYPTTSGPLLVSYTNDGWSHSNEPGRQVVTAGDTSVTFFFTDSPEPNHRRLNYSLVIPSRR